MGNLKMNGTDVSTSKENGLTIVSITTEDADIIVNGVKVWSKYDKPEYMKVPPVLRSFIYGKNDYINAKEGENVTVDCWLKENYTCATFYIPENLHESITTRFDCHTSVEELENEYIRNTDYLTDDEANALVAKLNTLFKSIEDEVASAGYNLTYSHRTGDFTYAWWDVNFNLRKWNEEKFLAIWNRFEDFNSEVSKFYDIYNS